MTSHSTTHAKVKVKKLKAPKAQSGGQKKHRAMKMAVKEVRRQAIRRGRKIITKHL